MKNVLITGGTGFFGRHFTKRLLETDVERICIYSRNEYNQFIMRKQFNDDPRIRFFIGDVRDKERLGIALNKIDTVIHAAALKRTETCDYNCFESVNTNVFGTKNIIYSCIDKSVEKVILLSSDKACNPTTTYGFTKAISENMFSSARYMSNSNISFCVARYGNVANSTGSVIPIWRELLKKQDWVPLTDDRCTRFYMSVEAAVEMINAIARNEENQNFYYPMLKAFSMKDLSIAMGAKEAKITGLPAGEKLHEEMVPGMSSESAQRMTIEEIKKELERM